MYGKKTCVAYSEKVFVPPGASMLVIAAPSRMMTSTCGLATFSCGGSYLLNIPRGQTFCPVSFCPSVIGQADMPGSHEQRSHRDLHHAFGMQ